MANYGTGPNWSVMIVTAAVRDAMNKVMCAMELDVMPGKTFGRHCCAVDDPSETVTHYLSYWGTNNETDAALRDLRNLGTVPPINGLWEDFELTEAQVTAAGAGLFVASCTQGDMTEVQHCEAILAGRGLRMLPH